ncbi:MAG: PilZ domain-containing protein [Aquisalinus sp.]|nr:PilZ domain-containing protein [Aquisalinus sp.]
MNKTNADKTDKLHVSDDQRKHRRVHLPLPVKILLPDGTEHNGHTINVSAGGILIKTSAQVETGTKIHVTSKQLGKMEGTVVSVEDTVIAIELEANRTRLRRLADTLLWLCNDAGEFFNRRKADRVSKEKCTTANLADGREVRCEVIDISVTGASIEITPLPDIDSIITIGKIQGRVVRHHPDGVGIEFTPQTKNGIGR